MRMLIVSARSHDDRAWQSVMRENGYSLEEAESIREMMDSLRTAAYDVVMTDEYVEGVPARLIVRRMRRAGWTTPVMVIGEKGNKDVCLEALDNGAGDFLLRPVSARELLIRLRVLLARPAAGAGPTLAFEDIQLNTDTMTLSSGENRTMLTGTEYRIMRMLLSSPGRIYSTEQILDSVWSDSADAGTGSVFVYMCFLRKKMRAIGSATVIRAHRGTGYCLEMSGSQWDRDTGTGL